MSRRNLNVVADAADLAWCVWPVRPVCLCVVYTDRTHDNRFFFVSYLFAVFISQGICCLKETDRLIDE